MSRRRGRTPAQLDSTREGEVSLLVDVHSAELLEVWVFGDFQSPSLSPGEQQTQRIETSPPAPLRCDQARPFNWLPAASIRLTIKVTRIQVVVKITDLI